SSAVCSSASPGISIDNRRSDGGRVDRTFHGARTKSAGQFSFLQGHSSLIPYTVSCLRDFLIFKKNLNGYFLKDKRVKLLSFLERRRT
ncbi:unnamed protein product, partial [Allacma fusca]